MARHVRVGPGISSLRHTAVFVYYCVFGVIGLEPAPILSFLCFQPNINKTYYYTEVLGSPPDELQVFRYFGLRGKICLVANHP